MTKLDLAPGLALPIEAVTEKLAFLGRTGSGKTYGAQRLAEEMYKAGAQFVVVDPVGVWYALRLAADGKSPGLEIPVLGGLHGDIPLEAGAGALIANLVVDRGVSMVLDVSQFESDADKARFAHAFADRFFFRKKAAPSAVHVFIEEAQEFVPQNPQREETRMLHAFTRLEKLGRNFGVGISLISQRPQEVNKKALNQIELLFAFQMTGPQERKTVEGWIAEKGIDEDIAGELPKLERGEPHVWSPAWLKISKRVRISPKWTYDASSTPKVGAKADARPLAPIDLKKLQQDMVATIAKAKAEDPRELRRRIAELEGELRKKNLRPTQEKPAPEPKRVEVEVVKPATLQEIRRATAALEAISQRGETFLERTKAIVDEFREGHARLGTAALQLASALQARLATAPVSPVRGVMHQAVEMRFTPAPSLRGPGEKMAGGERRILTALAQYPQGRTKAQVAILAQYAVDGGGFLNLLGALRSKGWIEGAENLVITAAGHAALGAYDPLPRGRDLLDHWLRKLGRAERAILETVASAYPRAMTRTEIAEKTGYAADGGGFLNALGRLRTLELVAGRAEIRAAEGFFE